MFNILTVTQEKAKRQKPKKTITQFLSREESESEMSEGTWSDESGEAEGV